jgi:hypothetical protein
MSKHRAGTLVMLNEKGMTPYATAPKNGAIGEVQDATGKTDWYVRADNAVVSFPHNKSPHHTGFWQYHQDSLIPISDPGIDVSSSDEQDVGEGDVVKMGEKNSTPVEKPVGETV